MSSMLINVQKTNSREFSKILISCISNLTTDEIILVLDKVHWWRITWDKFESMWKISKHDERGWYWNDFIPTDNLVNYIEAEKEFIIRDYHSIQCSTPFGLHIFERSSPLRVMKV